MNFRQRILGFFYPLIMAMRGLTKRSLVIINSQPAPPPVSFYSLSAKMNNGRELDFEELRGKKALLVNTASNCGYTGQYAQLQKLYEQNRNKLQIIGFPANDFQEQEKGSDQEISEFCSVNFGVTFPLIKKSQVIAGPRQHPVYQWLSQKGQNGWNGQQPTWNFSKYLIDEQGVLTHYFDPGASPTGDEMQKALSSSNEQG